MDVLFQIRKDICEVLKMMSIFQSNYEGCDVSFIFGYKIYHNTKLNIKKIWLKNYDVSEDIYEIGSLKQQLYEFKRRYDERISSLQVDEVCGEIQENNIT